MPRPATVASLTAATLFLASVGSMAHLYGRRAVRPLYTFTSQGVPGRVMRIDNRFAPDQHYIQFPTSSRIERGYVVTDDRKRIEVTQIPFDTLDISDEKQQ